MSLAEAKRKLRYKSEWQGFVREEGRDGDCLVMGLEGGMNPNLAIYQS